MTDDVGWGDQDGFRSPQEAALAGYHDGEGAHILRIEVISNDQVDVIVDTEPSHPCAFIVFEKAGSGTRPGTLLSKPCPNTPGRRHVPSRWLNL